MTWTKGTRIPPSWVSESTICSTHLHPTH